MEQRSKNLEEAEHRPSSPPAPSAPLPCANNCGFFGSAATLNLCSKCFRDSLRAAASQSGGPASSANATPESEVASPLVEESTKQTRKRCAACGRKVGLMGFECRCGGVFCGAHRYSDRHECGYDYRGAGRDAIARANPVVRADKVDKL